MAKILLVEDDLDLCASLSVWLEAEQHSVDMVHDGQEGAHRMRYYQYDLAVVDWNLPKLTGVEMCKAYRESGGHAAIIMLTGNDSVRDKESGLDAGADDYLTKPFDFAELAARIRALLRRPHVFTGTVLKAKDVILDTTTRKVKKGDAELQLIPKEFALLEFLMRHPNETFSPEALLDRVWSSDCDSSVETVYTTIKTLRKKISPESTNSIIKTAYGLGYKLETQ